MDPHSGRALLEWAEKVSPSIVRDLGANIDRFSSLLQAPNRNILSLDSDPDAVEVHWRQRFQAGGRRVLPLLVALAHPPCHVGWAHSERPLFPE